MRAFRTAVADLVASSPGDQELTQDAVAENENMRTSEKTKFDADDSDNDGKLTLKEFVRG